MCPIDETAVENSVWLSEYKMLQVRQQLKHYYYF